MWSSAYLHMVPNRFRCMLFYRFSCTNFKRPYMINEITIFRDTGLIMMIKNGRKNQVDIV